MSDHKPILCLDFDGCIHAYSKGWQDGTIYDDVVWGFFEWAIEAAKYFKLVIYSSRSKSEEGVAAMRDWLHTQALKWQEQYVPDAQIPGFEFASEKPPAFLTIDDRGLTFRGRWSDFPPQELLSFKPWNQQPKAQE